MDPRFSKYVAGVLLLAAVVSGACSHTDAASSPAGPTSVALAAVTAEPDRVEPELLPRGSCTAFPGFRTRFTLVGGGGHAFAVRALRFNLVDRFGNSAVPLLLTTAINLSTTASSMPIQLPTATPIPNAMPIPVPAGGRVDGLSPVSGQRLPLMLEFGCNVRTGGTLTVGVETADERGRTNTSHVFVRVGD